MKFFEKIKKVITEPKKFFHAIKKEKGIGQAFLYYLIFLVIVTLFSIFYYQRTVSGTWLILTIIGMFLLSLASLFIMTALINLFCRLLKGKGRYPDTFKAVVYGSTPSLIVGPLFMLYYGLVGINTIALIPAYVILFIISIWAIVLEIIGIKAAHKISTWRAVLATIIFPILLVIVIVIILIVIFIAIFSSILASAMI